MKVSRKVGRRIRKHTSSISRRRLRNKKSYKKNSYRKKYAKTQRGGKRSRSYKRMRAHTHKRGKRFHRGGTDLIELSVKKNGTNYLGIPFREQEQTFKMNITIPEDNYAKVELERNDDSSIKFTIKAEPDVFIYFLQHLNNAYSTTMHQYDFKELKVDNGNGTYNFFTTDNIAKFKEIAKKIAEKIEKAKYAKEAKLLQGELEKAADDKEKNPTNLRLANAKFNLALAKVNYHDAVINLTSDKDNDGYAMNVEDTRKLLLEAESELKIQEAAVRYFN